MKNRILRKRIRLFIVLLLIGFTLLNLFAYVHAYRFTHFTTATAARTTSPEKLNFIQKLALLFTGVSNPKPVNSDYPKAPFEEVTINSRGHLSCWYISSGKSAGTVALFHGYTSNKAELLPEATHFLRMGYNVLLVDLRGAGSSDGTVTTVGYHEAEDVKAVYKYLRKHQPDESLYLYGVSMGAVAILRATSEFNLHPEAVIVECPYGSMLQTARNRFTAMGIPAFPFANLLVFWGGVQHNFSAFEHNTVTYASRISSPVLILYGEQDKRVTRSEINQIYEALKGQKQLVTFSDAGHEPYHPLYPQQWNLHIYQFMQRHAH